MAQAVRAKDAGLLVEINKALAVLAESGAIKKAYADLGVPHRTLHRRRRPPCPLIPGTHPGTR